MKWSPENADIVLVDMDGVLADFEEPNNRILRDHGIAPVENRTDFYYADTYRDSPEIQELIYRENRRPGFFESFPVIDGANKGLQRIRDAGFRPRICSSPLEEHPTVVGEKRRWLAARLGDWAVEDAIFDRNKSGYDASSLIDDRPTVRGADNAPWQQVMFTQPYNLGVETDYRLNGWNDPRLEEVLERAREQYLRTHR